MTFTAQHFTRSHTIQLAGSAKTVFYLFEPIGEKAWAEGWNPQMIYPASGSTQVGAVFSTQGHDGAQTIWTILEYDRDSHYIKYLRLAPESHLALIEITCREKNVNETEATVAYTFTALSEAGNAYLAKFTEAYYREWLGNWEKAIHFYLKHGKMLTHH